MSLIGVSLLPLMSLGLDAAPPVAEISAIMSERALKVSSSGNLRDLAANSNLNKHLLKIDPYARYVPPSSSLKVLHSETRYLGLDLYDHKSRIWIQSIPGGPAEKNGLPETGILLAINGKKIRDDDLKKVSMMMDEVMLGNQVILKVSCCPTCKGNDYKLKPSLDKAPPVTWRFQVNTLSVRIREFITHYTAPFFLARYLTLSRPGTTIYLDLRGCSGGDLYEALEIAGMFVPAGLILAKTYDRNGKENVYKSPAGQKLKRPYSVLIDNKTASAAEILAGILRYHKISNIVGVSSYGKCLSQTVFPLSNGGELWLTTADVRFPDNRSCTGMGIEPDIYYPDISVASMTEIASKINKEVSSIR